jgi:predicted RNA binding protein YcfA (HicA-like mRNA interferase family)
LKALFQAGGTSIGKRMKAREIIRIIETDGWYFHSQRGSRAQYKHPLKPGRVTVPMHGSKDLSKFDVQSILKQAGLK